MVHITTQFPANLTVRRLLVMVGLLALNAALIVLRWDSVIADMLRHDLSATNSAVLLFILLTTLWVGREAEDRFKFAVPADRASADRPLVG